MSSGCCLKGSAALCVSDTRDHPASRSKERKTAGKSKLDWTWRGMASLTIFSLIESYIHMNNATGRNGRISINGKSELRCHRLLGYSPTFPAQQTQTRYPSISLIATNGEWLRPKSKDSTKCTCSAERKAGGLSMCNMIGTGTKMCDK